MLHKRDGNAAWKLRKSAGLFGGGGPTLEVEATRAVRKGEAISMDFGPSKMDGAVLLDHGVLDAATARVGMGTGHGLVLAVYEGGAWSPLGFQVKSQVAVRLLPGVGGPHAHSTHPLE